MNDERIQFLEWKNEKAILQQKIQIQEMFIQEAKEREENLRKMNEIFINTLNQQQNENVVQKFQKTYEQVEIEKKQDIINAQQIQIKLFEGKLAEKEHQINQIQKSYEKEIEKLQKRIVELEYLSCNKENINYQNIIEYQVNQQYDDEKALQQRKRNQSPSHPTTRIRVSQQQQQLQQISNNKFDESTCTNQDSTDISGFLNRINPNLQRQMKDIQNKLYNTKKKLTTTTEQETSFIRQSIQKIKNRSRNHSISINENPYCEQRSTWDDQVEYRTNQTNQTNQSLMCNGFRFS
ncbi:unnamed protein product (macronuclear) [Paramecium tetraurelia]|uniref:Uncharacterized protein n=1 Tax=Paramecium tetraurelia TaxID=5888 RepID=A0DA19_PARTE|nr:uncharacterized protein GSPATT00014818001 [Paramecium tetraurelia]CAK79886.1 unnamed protein product [Paramecium tetraurelia]|eukprot:XP_001447283.1 hypothetical protein (macronuclear) [Paramecium tetraurelia strain d4-2]